MRRFSLRWMLLLIMLAAVFLAGERMRRARNYRLMKAAEYAQEEHEWRRVLPQLERQLARGRGASPRFAKLSDDKLKQELDDIRDVADNHRAWAEHSLRLARYYEEGARRPWAPLGKEPETPPEISGR